MKEELVEIDEEIQYIGQEYELKEEEDNNKGNGRSNSSKVRVANNKSQEKHVIPTQSEA